MANRDGIVSIGFDYKKELDEVCATIEKELTNLGGDINLSDGIKKQMAEVKKMIADMKKDIGSSFDKITETKLDTKTFESFKKDVNKRIREINKEVTTLKEQFSTLDGSANVNGIVQQFANLKKHVEDSNASISEFINNSEKLGKSVIISPNLNTDTLKNDVVKIRKLLTDLNKEDLDFGYTNKSTKELTNDLEGLVDKYYRITDLIDEMKMSMNGMDTTTQEYKNQQVQLSKLSLELIKCSAQMDDLFAAKNAEKINVDKIISIDELDDIFAHVKDISSKVKLEAKNIVESIELSNTAVKNVNNNTTSDLSNKSNIEVHISTKQSTINKQLDEMIDNLQQRAANKPIIAPVKLRVDSEYEKTTKDASAPALTENQINEARKDVESVVPGLEKAFNNSMRIATNKAVENAKESIKAVREFFETNPITVHLTIPEDERLKISKSILSENGKTTVDISGQVDKARKSVKGLSEDLEKSQLLIKDNAQNAKNLSLEKLVNSLSETMTQFSELKGIISSIQNMENTIARTSGISSTSELVDQWNIVEKTIINATKLDGDFRKNANMGKIVSEYQKYIDMGGTNALSSIDKIKDNETTINSILSKMKELKSQDIENGSIQKLSVDLDGVIAKFDELISTVKTATNALYKIIKQGNVSDLDKQWSSISNKFKSIADESGKINLSKQKTDIKELMDMYQKYENAGGANSLMSLTDNVETLRKLDKEYQKLNQNNSSTIEKESESFKNVEKSVDSLTTAIGDTKVQAINVEATAMEDAAEREIMAIRSILDNLDLVVNRLKDIKGIKLPKIEVKNIDVVEKTVESLENTGNKSNISSGTPIKDVFQGDESSKINEVVEATNNLADAENRLNIVEDKKSAQKYWQGRFKDSISDMTKPNDELVRMNKYYSDLEKLNEKITSAQNKVDNANIDIDKLSKRDVQSNNYVKAIKNYKNAVTELQNYINSLNKNGIQSQDDIDELNRLQKAVDEVSKSIKNMSAPEKGTSIAKSSTVFLKIEELRDKYKGMSNDMLNELDKLERKFREAGNSLDTGKAIGELKQFETQLIKTGTATNSLWSAMKDKAFYNFANQLGTMFSFYDLINVGREIVTNIKEVDTALTELRKVSDATEQRLATNFKNSTDTAKELGATISDVISATADWSRMGYNIDQAEELARVSTLYKNVGDGIDIETANNSLISTLQGFQLDTSEAESIIDKFNEVANNYAIDSAGIGEALQRSAASFNAANTDLSKSIALITATNEVVQDPDSVGTLWKTMSARIRGAETELEELGEETDEYTKTTSKLRDLVQSLTGFDIMIDEDTFKDVYEIILGIGKEWDNLTDAEQASLGEALAGKRNANALYAVLGNLDTLQDAYETAENSAGSAMREQENYEKSIQYSLDRLSASAQEWSNTLVSSDVIKWFVDLANAAVELSTALTPLGTLALGGGLFAGIKNIGREKCYPSYRICL